MALDFEKNGFQTIVEKSTDALIIINEDLIIQFVNPAAESILNRSQDDLIGEHFQYNIEEGQSKEIDLIRNDGNAKTGEFSKVDIKWNGEKAFLISIRDITKRVMYDKIKDDFVSCVSHELRTPITIIKESVSQVHDGVFGNISEEQKKLLSVCIRSTHHLRKLVDDLLDISKIEAGKIKMRKQKANLIEVANSALETFRPMIKKKGLELKADLPETLLNAYIDRDRITQVLNNLIGNAIKFTENGKIEISVREENSHIECSVLDTGRGIATEDLSKVFDKFQQFGTILNGSSRGTGLGLAISKEIVQLHDGDVCVDSVLNKGSTFSFHLPKYKPDIEVLDKIENRIRQTNEPFALLDIKIHNIDEIKKNMGSDIIESINTKILQMLIDFGKQIDPAYIQVENHITIIDNEPKEQTQLNKIIIRLVKETFIELAENAELNFSYGLSKFSDASYSSDQLLDQCRKNMINEQEERLNKKIIIVDDEKDLTESVKILLEFFGYDSIDIANSGMEGLEKIRVNTPDLIILDMKMPGMSGYEVIGRLKENKITKDIPILIMSGFEVEKGQFYDDISKKAILTINKPASAEMLRKMVYYLL